ncbi:MAG: DUF502 domain-containing protein [Deltaproteobacteria bacterium]|nr:DUF502 domain-containing protein [Deltaproteobacteria bacterium]
MSWVQIRSRLQGAARRHFLTGLLVIVPLGLTYYVVSAIVGTMDQFLAILPPTFHPDTYLPFRIPGLGILFTLIIIQVVGFLGANLFGRGVVKAYERLLARIPLVRSIYAGVKQVMEQLLSERSDRFRRVVLFEFPRKGILSLGFVTGEVGGEIGGKTASRSVNVFIPCTPNPTSGFYLIVPEEELIPVDLSVEQAFKIILSGGMVGGEEKHKKARHSEERRALATDAETG